MFTTVDFSTLQTSTHEARPVLEPYAVLQGLSFRVTIAHNIIYSVITVMRQSVYNCKLPMQLVDSAILKSTVTVHTYYAPISIGREA